MWCMPLSTYVTHAIIRFCSLVPMWTVSWERDWNYYAAVYLKSALCINYLVTYRKILKLCYYASGIHHVIILTTPSSVLFILQLTIAVMEDWERAYLNSPSKGYKENLHVGSFYSSLLVGLRTEPLLWVGMKPETFRPEPWNFQSAVQHFNQHPNFNQPFCWLRNSLSQSWWVWRRRRAWSWEGWPDPHPAGHSRGEEGLWSCVSPRGTCSWVHGPFLRWYDHDRLIRCRESRSRNWERERSTKVVYNLRVCTRRCCWFTCWFATRWTAKQLNNISLPKIPEG